MIGRRGERGLALVVVLWGIAALALIAGAMLAASLNAAKIDRNAWAQLKVQTAADAGVQIAILSLFDPDPGGLPPLDGRPHDIAFEGVTVSVAIQDETGLIDLNFAGRGRLRDFFKLAGADNADILAGRVVDWRSPKGTISLNGASAGDYENAGYRPRGAPFQSVGELNLVLGMTPDLFARVAPNLTIYSHSADFDTRTAPREVLQTIPGISPAMAAQTIATRPGSIARPGHAFAITATAVRARMRFVRRAVVLLTGDPARPYWILNWK